MNNLIGRLRRRSSDDGPEQQGHGGRDHDLESRVAALEAAVEENRRLKQRLAEVVDVVTELATEVELARAHGLERLSMGTSQDWEVAVD